MPEFTDIRNPIDENRLADLLTKLPESITRGVSLPEFTEPFEVKQFTFGQSNPTYYICDGNGQRFVLRRKPMPNAKLVSKSAHAIEREFFILRGIAKCNEDMDPRLKVPVPEVFFLCEDESHMGFVFYVMEYVEGRPIKRPDMPGISKENQKLYWDSIMTTISAIHSVNCLKLVEYLPARHFPQFQPERLAKLDDKSPSYFERQIKTLTAVEKSQSQSVDSIPNFNQLMSWISEHAPRDPTNLTLIHGDCKIDNFMFHRTEPKVIAVLDWELCTIGHPLFDLANFLQPYIFPNNFNQIIMKDTSIGIEDPQSASHVQYALKLYEERLDHVWRTGDSKNNPRDLWKLGSVFGLLRLAVISQGVAMRLKKGTASSAQASVVASLYGPLAELATSFVSGEHKL